MKISFYIFTWHNFNWCIFLYYDIFSTIFLVRYFANMLIERRVDKYSNKHGKLPAIIKPGVGGVFKNNSYNKNITSSNSGNE